MRAKNATLQAPHAVAAALAVFVLSSPLAVAQDAGYGAMLDDGRQWVDIEAGLAERLPPLQRAAAAVALNDSATAERLLLSIIGAEPGSEDAHRAYELLSRLYLRSGQYARLIQNFESWKAVFPGRPEVVEEEKDIALFRGLPDQLNGPRGRANLDHEAGDDFSLPLMVNGRAARYLLDTGAWVNVMTEGELARLELTAARAGGRIGDASGAGVAARTVVVGELTIGSMTLENVSFIVVPSEEPGGIVGMPILLALGSVQWTSDGRWQIGEGGRLSNRTSNLVFYENKLLLATDVLAQRVFGTLDTGAVSTDLNGNFATQFAAFVERNGTKRTQEITGLGGTTTFDAIELPEVRFAIAGTATTLSPAHVTLQTLPSMGGECCIGNIGRDLLLQARRIIIDVDAMTLSFGGE